MISLKRYALFFSMVWLSILRGLPLERLSIVIPKASTIRLRNFQILNMTGGGSIPLFNPSGIDLLFYYFSPLFFQGNQKVSGLFSLYAFPI